MRSLLSLAVAGIAISGVAVPMARAQRGVGDATGVVRQSLRPEIVLLSGKIIEVQTGPCAATTGRSLTGAHVILESPDKEQFNIHLGPAEALARVVARLSAGQEIAVRAFRTEQMKENHYVAQTLTVGKTTVELRDASLRPAWALGGTAPRGMAAGWAGRGRGRGGPGWGRGRGGWPAPQQPGAVIAERRPAATGKEMPGIRDIKQPATAGIIAVTAVEPSLDAALDPRFGRCRYILLVNTERETFEAPKTQTRLPAMRACRRPRRLPERAPPSC